MSISAALANALTGLTVNARATEIVSSNVANAMTEGYGRRELEITAQQLGGVGAGVRVIGVQRHSDPFVLADRRLADAAVGHGTTSAGFFETLKSILGEPGEAGSLSDRFARLDASLIEATSRPDSDARLNAVLSATGDLVEFIQGAADSIQQERMRADQQIASEVDRLNAGLIQVREFNVEIQEARMRGQDPTTLIDLRQQTIDSLSAIVPLKQYRRENDMIALYTVGGATLLDGKAAEFSFSATGTIVPEMTIGSGALSGLSINDRPTQTGGGRSPIAGGSLAALFEIRDALATGAQAHLDAVARDLVERFQDPALDATRAPGAAGLITDAGAAFDPADELALSTRLRLNAAADPAQGGAIWRLRDGLGAAVPGDVGNGQLLQDLAGALDARRVPVSGGFAGAARSASGLAAEFLSIVGSEIRDRETSLGYARARHEELKALEYRDGVDTDEEMQRLLLLEQAYAANAKVISTADDLIQMLMRL